MKKKNTQYAPLNQLNVLHWSKAKTISMRIIKMNRDIGCCCVCARACVWAAHVFVCLLLTLTLSWQNFYVSTHRSRNTHTHSSSTHTHLCWNCQRHTNAQAYIHTRVSTCTSFDLLCVWTVQVGITPCCIHMAFVCCTCVYGHIPIGVCVLASVYVCISFACHRILTRCVRVRVRVCLCVGLTTNDKHRRWLRGMSKAYG